MYASSSAAGCAAIVSRDVARADPSSENGTGSAISAADWRSRAHVPIEQERLAARRCAASRRCLRRTESRDRRPGSTRCRRVGDRAVDVRPIADSPTCGESSTRDTPSLRSRSRPHARAQHASRCARPIGGRSTTIGMPSLVLMENAGRQVVAAMEADVRRAGRRCASPCSAGAATTAATASSSRACCSSASVDVGVYLIGAAARRQGRRARQSRRAAAPRRRRRRDRRRRARGSCTARTCSAPT